MMCIGSNLQILRSISSSRLTFHRESWHECSGVLPCKHKMYLFKPFVFKPFEGMCLITHFRHLFFLRLFLSLSLPLFLSFFQISKSTRLWFFASDVAEVYRTRAGVSCPRCETEGGEQIPSRESCILEQNCPRNSRVCENGENQN